MKRRTFDREFKLSVVHQMEAGATVAQVCREHELKEDLVYRWRHEYKKDPERAFAGHGNPATLEARNAELERLVGQLYAENRLLKKALEKLGCLQAERLR